MNRREHINALAKLGCFINAWLLQDETACGHLAGKEVYTAFNASVRQALQENEWFTEQGIRESFAAIAAEMLGAAKLEAWLQAYPYNNNGDVVKPIGVIAAGNIPLVCFHDVICVLLLGYSLLLKPSSKDSVLISRLVELLIYFEPRLRDKIALTHSIKQQAISALIATGSNNTARYIEYEYSTVPILSRKNRTSVAVLTGNETEEELRLLSDDVFSYFGMGCRNVSKLYVPEGYNFSLLLSVFGGWAERLGQQAKYINSYRHERAISLSLNESLLDGEAFLLKQSKLFNSPLSVIYYDFFSNLESIKSQLLQNADLLQCVVAGGSIGNVSFGQAQKPTLSDYADSVDTIQWLTNNVK